MGQLSVDLSSKASTLHPSTPKRSLPIVERKGVTFPRYFTQKLEAFRTPYDEIPWELRTASIGNDKGAVIFEQRDVEVPADWSQTATNIVVSKYFHGKIGSPERERSVRQLVHRVVDTIADWGLRRALFHEPMRTPRTSAMSWRTSCSPEGLLQFAGLVQRRREGSPRLRLVLRRGHRPHSSS